MEERSPTEQSTTGKGQHVGRRLSRRRFMQAMGVASVVAGPTLVPSLLMAQTPQLTKATLRPVVDAADLAITDAQLEKLAPAANWGMGELRKLRDVDVGLGGPAPIFLPKVSSTGEGTRHE